ncbi:tyrosine-type recombinase/integrase [Caballeronia glathei]|uniref:tyrosine-type recombinase/integrase n=1 Tax=Caballeronia glathei TaxID=60547 RepID=UPI0009DEADA2
MTEFSRSDHQEKCQHARASSCRTGQRRHDAGDTIPSIYVIKQVFENAVANLALTGEPAERAAERLRQASAHWLRHTAGSHMMDRQVDLRYVRDNLGHASISTTSQYLHADDDDRHRATESGLKLNW